MSREPLRPGARFLIVEAEAVIALYVESLVEAAFGARCEIVYDFAAAGRLADRFGDFALAIVNHPRPSDEPVAGRLAAACRAIVVSTGAPADLASSRLAGAVTVPKPFVEADLLAACRLALDRAGPA
jgi:DNA-binding response OmpR family regulator